MKKYNILYWNIHYEDGNQYIPKKKEEYKKHLDYASHIVINTLDEYIKKKKINVIVLTEAYPQVGGNDNEPTTNNKIMENYKEKFNVFPYEPYKSYAAIQFETIFPFVKPHFYNGVMVIVKKDLNFDVSSLKYISLYPNLLSIENNDIQIIGLRFCQQNGKNIVEQIKKIKEIVNTSNKPIIMLGDYNPSLILREEYGGGENNLFSWGINKKDAQSMKGNNKKQCEIYDLLLKNYCNKPFITFDYDKGTSLVRGGKDTFPDKFSICSEVEYIIYEQTRLQTAEEVYFDKDYIDIDNHVIGKDIKNAKFKEEYEEYKNNGLKILGYDNSGLKVKAPFPDHNLMYVSIEI